MMILYWINFQKTLPQNAPRMRNLFKGKYIKGNNIFLKNDQATKLGNTWISFTIQI